MAQVEEVWINMILIKKGMMKMLKGHPLSELRFITTVGFT